MKEFKALIIAASDDAKMNSAYPAVMHKICGKEMILWVKDAAEEAGAAKITVATDCDIIKSVLGDGIEIISTDKVNKADYDVILYGNMPLITADDILKKSGIGECVNDRIALADAEKVMQKRIVEKHMKNGVTFILPETTVVESGVEIGKDTVVYPGAIIKKGTKIGENCTIGMNTQIDNSTLADNVNVLSSVIIDSEIDSGTSVGPFAYLRPNSKIGKDVRVGDFVEIKNSNVDNGTKISHLTYVGDSDVGKRVNFGCGTVTVNYDGKKKYRTKIGDDCFIGCNTNLVAPVTVEAGGYTAAGSTITDTVPENALAIARARQVIKKEWKDRRKQN